MPWPNGPRRSGTSPGNRRRSGSRAFEPGRAAEDDLVSAAHRAGSGPRCGRSSSSRPMPHGCAHRRPGDRPDPRGEAAPGPPACPRPIGPTGSQVHPGRASPAICPDDPGRARRPSSPRAAETLTRRRAPPGMGVAPRRWRAGRAGARRAGGARPRRGGHAPISIATPFSSARRTAAACDGQVLQADAGAVEEGDFVLRGVTQMDAADGGDVAPRDQARGDGALRLAQDPDCATPLARTVAARSRFGSTSCLPTVSVPVRATWEPGAT